VHYVVRAPTGHVATSALGGLAARKTVHEFVSGHALDMLAYSLLTRNQKLTECWDKLMW